jgi:hypothetical protein
MLSNFDLSIAQRLDRCHMNKSERCEPVDEVDDGERERRKRRDFIRHLRAREARKERFYMNEDEKRERRIADYDRREHERREQRENEAVNEWLVQRQCGEDIRRSVGEAAARTTSAAAVAAEPQLTEVFDYSWVQRHVAARLRDLETRFDARLAELTDAVAENAHAIANAFEEVDRALAKAGAKANKELTGALQRITQQLSENQHAIMRAINNRVGDAKPSDEAKSAPAKVH